MKKELLKDLELQMAEWIDYYYGYFPDDNTSKLWEMICEELKIDLDDAVISEMYNSLLPKK